ncbi:MAG: hypothetical protein NVSMB52_06440 [Chloroflexota bacterium]
MILGLCISQWSLPSVSARGVFWLRTQAASDASFDHLNPVLVAFHNHAYILSVRVNGTSSVTSVFFTTNESGKWATSLLSDKGPENTYSSEFTSLAVDATTGRLYALWLVAKGANEYAANVWTRDTGGQWNGPTDIATAGILGGYPSIVAGNGKAYAAFISSTFPGACDDSTTRDGDVQVVAYNGTSWAPPQNLSSCVADTTILAFENPKLALDEAGHAYLVTAANNDLWYTDNTSGSWAEPTQMTHGANVPQSVGTALRTFYGIAASSNTTYVTYVHRVDTTPSDDVLLTSRPNGGSWSAPVQVSPQDPQDCPKFGLSIVANVGRVGVSYGRGHTGYCHGSSGISGNAPFVFTGTPGSMSLVPSLEGTTPDCFNTSMANEGALFRVVFTCDQPATLSKGQLYYKAEFLDTVGPVAKLFAPATARAPQIQLHWKAHDPQPGSGVAYFQLGVRDGTGSWHTLLKSTRSKQFVYRSAHAGHRYTFRLRARDRAANWGAWVMASTRVG